MPRRHLPPRARSRQHDSWSSTTACLAAGSGRGSWGANSRPERRRANQPLEGPDGRGSYHPPYVEAREYTDDDGTGVVEGAGLCSDDAQWYSPDHVAAFINE